MSENEFEALKLDGRLVNLLTADGGMGFVSPTPIQKIAIPLLQEKKNVLIKSQTGSGKTLSYLLPILNDLMAADPMIQRSEGTRALVIAPTRELCSQILMFSVK